MSTTTQAAQQHLEQLRAALADLPPGEVEEILGDVEVQLQESDCAEITRLGPAEAYAAELRSAAGYPAAAPGRSSSARPDLVRMRLGLLLLGLACLGALLVGAFGSGGGIVVGLVLAVALPTALGWLAVQHRPGLRNLSEIASARTTARQGIERIPEPVRELVASLRPAWWVLRAGLAAALVLLVLGAFSVAATLLLGVLLVYPSVRLAHAARVSRGWAWVALPLNVLAVGLLLSVSGTPADAGQGYASPDVVYQDVPGDLAVSNIYPFDADGTPLTGVYLYDQDGQPLKVWEYTCYDGTYENQPGVDQENPTNRFPLPHVVQDPETGTCTPQEGLPFSVAIPAGASPTSSSPSPSSGVGSATSTAPPTTVPPTTTAAPSATTAPTASAPTTTAPTTPAPTTTG